MQRTKSFLAAAAILVPMTLVACGDPSTDSRGGASSGSLTEEQGGVSPVEPGAKEAPPCMGEFEQCVADKGDPAACQDTLSACLPAPVAVDCQAEYSNCLAAGVPQDACQNMLDLCTSGPAKPEQPPCVAEFEQCVADQGDPAACQDILSACLPAPAAIDCKAEYSNCLAAGVAQDACQNMLDLCTSGPAKAQ